MLTAFVCEKGGEYLVRTINTKTNRAKTCDVFDNKADAEKKKDLVNYIFQKCQELTARGRK